MQNGRWGEVFPSRKKAGGAREGQVWERHLAFLKEHVPPENLVFFDVRDGWEPLVGHSPNQFLVSSFRRIKIPQKHWLWPNGFPYTNNRAIELSS